MKDLLKGRTKCLLVRPEFLTNTFYNLSDVYDLLGAKSAAPPLGLLIVAALLPKHWQLRFVDHDVTPLTEGDIDWADIVFVSGIGPQEETIMRVVRRAKAKGKLTVVGGSGACLQPQVYQDADFVICGEGEDTVPELLEDLSKGATSGTYRSGNRADMKTTVTPRYDLAQLDKYLMVGVQYVRGCPFACEFCAQIEIFGRKPRTKTTEQVVAELQLLHDLGYRGQIDFGYDNLIGDPVHCAKVLEAMRDWAIRNDHPFFYSTEATINLAKDDKLLRLMRDNDFRYVFVGIESADDEVLEQTKKSQNTTVSPVEACKTFNSYGMTVQTGLILGFDSETDQTADNILKMIQDTGAFPALVLPLHALPSTGLSRRLQEEGRLFREGELRINRDDRTDTATTGLNFVTTRPRTTVMRDLIHVLDQLYDPKNHYERLAMTISQLKPSPKFTLGLAEYVQMGLAGMRIFTSIGMDRELAPLFWPMLFKTFFTKPSAIETMVAQAVLHAAYAYQARSYMRALEDEIAYVEKVGEDEFNKQMLAQGIDAPVDVHRRESSATPATPPPV